jgi:hypothetical protein
VGYIHVEVRRESIVHNLGRDPLWARSKDHQNNCQYHRSLDGLVQACLFLGVERFVNKPKWHACIPLSGATPHSSLSTLFLPVYASIYYITSDVHVPFVFLQYILPFTSRATQNLLALYIVIENLKADHSEADHCQH